MKRNKFIAILAILMIATLIFASCANANNPAQETDQNISSGTNQVTDSAVDTDIDSETSVDTGKDSATEKQTFYEGYFNSETMEFAGEGIATKINSDSVKMNLTTNNDDFEMFIGEYGVGMYQQDGIAYLHIVMVEDDTDTVQDKWYKAPISEDQDLSSITDDFNIDRFNVSDIKTIQYLETKEIDNQNYDVIKIITSVIPEDISESDVPLDDETVYRVSSNLDSLESTNDVESKPTAAKEAIETEYILYVTEDTHVIVKMLSSSEEQSIGEDGEIVTETITIECTFFKPKAFALPEGVTVEDATADDLETTFGFALLAIMLGAMS